MDEETEAQVISMNYLPEIPRRERAAGQLQQRSVRRQGRERTLGSEGMRTEQVGTRKAFEMNDASKSPPTVHQALRLKVTAVWNLHDSQIFICFNY